MSVETIALIPRSKLPAAASSNHWEICTVLRLVSMLSVSLSIAWMATDQSLKVAASRTRNVDRKSTRLNSSHDQISYAVFCLKKKTTAHSVRLGGHTVRDHLLPSPPGLRSCRGQLTPLAAPALHFVPSPPISADSTTAGVCP